MDEFDEFWARYPRKVAKGDARKAWAQLRKQYPDLLARCAAALAWQCAQPNWVKDGGQFVPYPATYLRAEQFDDEPFVAPTLTDKNAQNMATLARLLGGRTAQ